MCCVIKLALCCVLLCFSKVYRLLLYIKWRVYFQCLYMQCAFLICIVHMCFAKVYSAHICAYMHITIHLYYACACLVAKVCSLKSVLTAVWWPAEVRVRQDCSLCFVVETRKTPTLTRTQIYGLTLILVVAMVWYGIVGSPNLGHGMVGTWKRQTPT